MTQRMVIGATRFSPPLEGEGWGEVTVAGAAKDRAAATVPVPLRGTPPPPGARARARYPLDQAHTRHKNAA